MPDSTGLSLYIPPLLSQSFFPDLRKLASLYKTLRPYLLLPNPRTPWSQYSPLFSSIFSISRAHLDLFPLPAACIRNIIPRYSSDFVFEKLHSAVYLIWSPFSKHFYIGSFDRVLDTSAFQRFSEHLKNAFQPRSNSTSLYVHTKMRAQPGIWCVAIVKANPEDAAAYEKYAIATLHPTLNRPPNNMKTTNHNHTPIRFRTAHNTTPMPTSQNKFIYKPTLLAVATSQPTSADFTPNLSTLLHPTQTNKTFLLYPGFQYFLKLSHKRLLSNTLVTLTPFLPNPNFPLKPTFFGTFSSLLSILHTLPPLLSILCFKHSPASLTRQTDYTKHFLTLLAQSKSLKTFKHTPTSTFVQLYKLASKLEPKQQTFLRHRLSTAFRKYHQAKLCPSLCFSLPFHPNSEPRHFRSTINQLYNLHNFHPAVQSHLKLSTTYATRRSPNIESSFSNYKLFASTWSLTPPRCVCSSLSHYFPNNPSDTHVGCKASELIISDPTQAQIFTVSCKTIPIPTLQNQTTEILEAFSRLAASFNPFANTTSRFQLPTHLPLSFPISVFSYYNKLVVFCTNTGNQLGSLTHNRARALFQHFATNKHDKDIFLTHLTQLFTRYNTHLSKQHWRTPRTFLSLLATNLQLTTECFASPLDWSYTIFTHYFSAFATDTPLGSFGDLFLHVSKLFGWVNPEYTPKQLLHAFLWCLYNATTTTTPARFLLFVPLRKKGESFKHLLSHSLVHRLFTFPPHSFSFDSPSHSLGFSARSNSAPFSLGLFLPLS